ncbi:twin-arginine translocation signal domain-containing protein [Paludibaculum fermentans]|uniref:Twin-arginine translocation signal domain-containing protein n=1 Tax=Paludibaculum fermentans TaxID=1473598 RepID=A0A7S7NY73_PALFE|nr:twin-arginine translocation signal domain-containing protein [Paludibaculum fermentans]
MEPGLRPRRQVLKTTTLGTGWGGILALPSRLPPPECAPLFPALHYDTCRPD